MNENKNGGKRKNRYVIGETTYLPIYFFCENKLKKILPTIIYKKIVLYVLGKLWRWENKSWKKSN